MKNVLGHISTPQNSSVKAIRPLHASSGRWAMTAALLAFMSLPNAALWANPLGEQVRHGNATFERSGNDLIIRQNGEKLIVNWHSFSIANGERTQFIQPGSSSSALNRVIGGARSLIDGRLDANGKVILINPAGLTVGPTGVVNVNSFVGTTLDITDENYLAGSALDLSGGSEVDVTNLGTVRAATGDVHLIAKHVVNSGTIEAPNGGATMTAATEVRIQPNSEQKIFIKPNSQKGGTVVNKGTIRAAAAEIQAAGNPYALAINLEGIIDVKGTAAKPAGKVKIAGGGGNVNVAGTLKTQKADQSGGRLAINEGETAPGIVNVAGTLDARGEGAAAGGELILAAENLLVDGTLDASGGQGGGINLTAKRASNSGTITAEGTTAAGGTIQILTKEAYLDTVSSKLIARGATTGGSIVVNASGNGARIYSSSTMDASGTSRVGGSIVVTSGELYLMASRLNANGFTGGGQVLVGGDYQGKNPAIQNAKTLYVSAESKFTANALTTGNGGKVVAWSDGTTKFYGTSEARGGAISGNGGLLEVSGKEKTTFGGFATAAAPNGQAGSFLLDPKNIVIGTGPGILTVPPEFEFVDPNKAAGNIFGGKTVALSTGNVVITATGDDLGGSNAGAVYLFNGATGALISALRGGSADDAVGGSGVQALPNGNFVVRSSFWDNGGVTNAGAVTWGNGLTGINGTVSASNSLVGTATQEQLGSIDVTLLTNGNYLVRNVSWNRNRGAVTWASGMTGISGTISSSNSLVGTTANDKVGVSDITVLSNGNYVVRSYLWNNGGISQAGAVTWGNGGTGITGTINASNSLIGITSGDFVGNAGVKALSNGNYVVISSRWSNGLISDAGAVTWANGETGISGEISASNSLVGSTVGARVGDSGVAVLSNGNYVVSTPFWDGGRGAVTWANGLTGIRGTINGLNSLVGENDYDRVGYYGVAPLSNGNYVVVSADWNGYRGAVTWGNGAVGSVGTVNAGNSLVGSHPNDFGSVGITALSNGNYVVSSLTWNGFRGAVTWASGTGATVGVVSAANSLVGSRENDAVGQEITTLINGNYVVASSGWNGGRGAATWGSGTGGTVGVVSAVNSLVGSQPNDLVGGRGVTALSNGNYVVNSWQWNDNRGAVTWGNGTKGVTGKVSARNSLVGSNSYDWVGGGGVTALPNGNYAVASYSWDNGSIVDAGAATLGNGTTGITGAVSPANSQVGGSANAGLAPIAVDPVNQTYLTRFLADTSNGAGGRVYASSIWGPGATGMAYSSNPSSNITLTAASITAITDTGTKVFLQANNDITVDEAIVTNNPFGNGGALILSAGRSIFVNANVTTDNGNLTLIANDLLANGVVDAYRDAGAAVITMAPSAVMDAGTGAVRLELRNGAGKTNRQSGAITLGDVTAETISAINAGPSTGSNLVLKGTLTASGGGNAIVLAGKQFINYSGAAALSATNGRWLVYANTVEGNAFGGLQSGQQAIYNRAAGSRVSAGGNRYVFAEQPFLKFTTTSVIKEVGDDLTATVVNQFTVSGWVNAALYGNVFTQDTLANTTLGRAVAASNGAAASATALDSPYSVVMDFTDLTVLNGYRFGQVATGIIVINPPANSSAEEEIDLSQLAANLLFDQSAQPFSPVEEDRSGEDSESELKDGFEIHFEGGTVGGMPAFLAADPGN